jgi:tRNA dimethylallyltransferase
MIPSTTLVIIGPTASGKSLLSIKKAKQVGAEVISADTVQVYRDFTIGSAKLTESEMGGVPHHLVGHVHPEHPYNVQQFLDDVTTLKAQLSGPIIICGGAALYLRALLYGYEPLQRLPDDDKPTGSAEDLWQKLNAIDPELASKTPFQNKARVQRYLELYLIYNQPPSQLFKSRTICDPSYTVIGISIERTELKERINTRVNEMIHNGLVDEVKYLMKKYSGMAPAFRAIGYKEVIQYLQNFHDKDTMIQTIKKNTFDYAKRQMTWFKRFNNVQWVPNDSI